MQDFSQLNSIIGSKAVSQLPNILSNAMTRLSNWESTVRALPGNYQSRFGDVFMYHYDKENHLVDDTPQDQTQSLQTMVNNAVAQAEGIKEYLSETTCGISAEIDEAVISLTNKVVLGNKLFTKDSLPQNMYFRAITWNTAETVPDPIISFAGDAVQHMYKYNSFGAEVTVMCNLRQYGKLISPVDPTQWWMHYSGECYVIIKWLDASFTVGRFPFNETSNPATKLQPNKYIMAVFGNVPRYISWAQYHDRSQFASNDPTVYDWYRVEYNERFGDVDAWEQVNGGVDGAMVNYSEDKTSHSRFPWFQLPSNRSLRFLTSMSSEPFTNNGMDAPQNIISNTLDPSDLQDLVNLTITPKPGTDLVDILSSEFINPQDVIDSLS